MPPRAWAGLVRAGILQRGRTACARAGLTGTASTHDRARAGTLSVLAAWLVFVLAGSAFAKFSENWASVARPARRVVPASAMVAMPVAAVVGALVWLAVGAVSWRAIGVLCRRAGLVRVVRSLRPALFAVALVVTASATLIEVAHHLTVSQRNGASAWYTVGFLTWAALCATCLVVVVGVVVRRVALRLDFSRRELRLLAGLDVMAMSAMGVVVGAMMVWWISLADSSHRFWSSTAIGAAPTGVSVPMVLIVVTMAGGFTLASWGTRRAIAELRRTADA